MKKWINIIGIVLLIFGVLVLWTNYISPCPQPERIFIDTCRVDTIKIDTTIKK